MAGSLNKVMLIGYIGNNLEPRYMDSGTAVLNMSMATNDTWKDQNGKTQTRAVWHKVVWFGKPAEAIAKYLGKGSRIYVEGSLRTKNYEDRNGVKRSLTEIVGKSFLMLDSKAGGKSEADDHGSDDYDRVAPVDDQSDIPF